MQIHSLIRENKKYIVCVLLLVGYVLLPVCVSDLCLTVDVVNLLFVKSNLCNL